MKKTDNATTKSPAYVTSMFLIPHETIRPQHLPNLARETLDFTSATNARDVTQHPKCSGQIKQRSAAEAFLMQYEVPGQYLTLHAQARTHMP